MTNERKLHNDLMEAIHDLPFLNNYVDTITFYDENNVKIVKKVLKNVVIEDETTKEHKDNEQYI